MTAPVETLSAEIRGARRFFYGTVWLQAMWIHLDEDQVVLGFAPQHECLANQVRELSSFLNPLASRVLGRPVKVWAYATGARES